VSRDTSIAIVAPRVLFPFQPEIKWSARDKDVQANGWLVQLVLDDMRFIPGDIGSVPLPKYLLSALISDDCEFPFKHD
jgi:hypothetical protein